MPRSRWLPGDKVGASVQVQEALEKLRGALRNGWALGKLGDLESPTRVNFMADLAVAGASSVLAIARYPASVMTQITNWLAVLEANEAIAGGGSRQAAIDLRKTARKALEKLNLRVRFYYCSVNDSADQSPELARIGFQPRRDPGDSQPQPLPGASGAVTWNAATRELSITALPANATSSRAFRKPAVGEAEPAGVSTGTTVSVTAYAPLTPNVSYEVWLAGHNSRGDGPESNRTTFTA